MHFSVPAFARFTFWVHVLIAVLLGLLLLVLPGLVAEWFGYQEQTEWVPVLRSYGAMILGFGGLTSYLGVRARSWDQVDFIVRGEIVYLTLSLVVYLISLVGEVGPTLMNLTGLVLSLVLLILFIITWLRRPVSA